MLGHGRIGKVESASKEYVQISGVAFLDLSALYLDHTGKPQLGSLFLFERSFKLAYHFHGHGIMLNEKS